MNKIIIILACIFIFSSGCHTIKEQSNEKLIKSDVSIENHYTRDSIFIYNKDSVYLIQIGDTVYYEKYFSTIKYIDRLKTDTVLKDKLVWRDKTVYKEKQLSKMQLFWTRIGKYAVVIIAAFIIFVIIYLIIRRWK